MPLAQVLKVLNNHGCMGGNLTYKKRHRRREPDIDPIADNIRRMQLFSRYPADAVY